MKLCLTCEEYVTEGEGTCSEFHCPMELSQPEENYEPLDFNTYQEQEYVPDVFDSVEVEE